MDFSAVADSAGVIIFFFLAVTLYIIAFFIWWLHERQVKNTSTAKTYGRVVAYAYGTPAKAPTVEYTVDGSTYRKTLQYMTVSIYSSPFGKIKAVSPSDLLSTKIKIYRNSVISFTNIMEEAFPIGSQMTVWYNPSNPKKAYVERYAGYDKMVAFCLIPAIPLWFLILWLLVKGLLG